MGGSVIPLAVNMSSTNDPESDEVIKYNTIVTNVMTERNGPSVPYCLTTLHNISEPASQDNRVRVEQNHSSSPPYRL